MELLALPVYIWSDLRDALGGPVHAFLTVLLLLSVGWISMRVTGIWISVYAERMRSRAAHTKLLLAKTEALLQDCQLENGNLIKRVDSLDKALDEERANCRQQLASHAREIHTLRVQVLDLKTHVLMMLEKHRNGKE